MKTEDKVKEITSDLYYDLLDKYIELKKLLDQRRIANQKLKHQLLAYSSYEKDSELRAFNNKVVDSCIAEIRKREPKDKRDYTSIIKVISNLKVAETENPQE